MKLEDLLKKCPECGSQDKKAVRKIVDNHNAHAVLDAFKCDNCGFIFEKHEPQEDEKSEIIKKLNKL
ncbi:TIGR04165 family Cys-rich peptide [Methanobrevibacter sp. DSM 116169]|uniref:TIGR04165 family Cys-rich peptide n=1 Tax=Methanobrevibacter sp. DSM 116169 TaxID=3242727 RepID=UPI0038FC71B0